MRTLADEQAQHNGDTRPSSRLSVSMIYDYIKRSNSSLNRKSKRLLEDSIENVLLAMREDEEDSEELGSIEGDFDDISDRFPMHGGVNRTIVAAWSNPGTTVSSNRTSKENIPIHYAPTTTNNSSNRTSREHLPIHSYVPHNTNNTNTNNSSTRTSREHLPMHIPSLLSPPLPNPSTDNVSILSAGSMGPPNAKKRPADGEVSAKRRKGNDNDRSPPTHVSLADLGGVDQIIQELEDLIVLPLLQERSFLSPVLI